MTARSLNACRAALGRLLLFGFLLAASATGWAAAPGPGYYAYILYLKDGNDTAQAVAQARQMLAPALRLHRLGDVAAVKSWQGDGMPPLAVAPLPVDAATFDEDTIHDTGEPLRDVLGTPPGRTGSALAIFIGYPRSLDIRAYIEALQSTEQIAATLRAPAVRDDETGELYRTPLFAERLITGRRGAPVPISPTNLPVPTIMAGMTTYERQPGGGVRTRGFRKLGLPDLVVDGWIPGMTHTFLFDVVGNLLIANEIPPTPGAGFHIDTQHPVVTAALYGDAVPGGRVPLRFAPALRNGAAGTPAELHIDFPGSPGMHVYERQMLFVEGLMGPRYKSPLGPARSRDISLAVARAKSRIADVRARYPAIRKQGGRVFVGERLDLLLEDRAPQSKGAKWIGWQEVVAWDGDGSITTRRWEGDPRRGGRVARMDRPVTIDGTTFVYYDSTGQEDDIEDILVIGADGKPSGGDVVDLVNQP